MAKVNGDAVNTSSGSRAETHNGEDHARDAGLIYVDDETAGIRRRKAGRSFSYRDENGKPVRDAQTLGRIRALAIPPAWSDVWICNISNGHLQATGFDAAGRKQYIYHPRWIEVRDQVKYDRIRAFGEALPSLRSQLSELLATPGLPREKVLAAVVALLDSSLIRIGNESYRRKNRSFGLTTLRNQHAEVAGWTVRFRFRGKSGILHRVRVSDRRLARVVKQCQEIPGQQLFEYLDGEGIPRPVQSGEVNEFLHELMGSDFTAKDFRTWAGSVIAFSELTRTEPPESEADRRRQVARATAAVASQLANTVAIARKSYIHPAIIEAHAEGLLPTQSGEDSGSEEGGLTCEEWAFLDFLRSYSEPETRRPAATRTTRARRARPSPLRW